MVGQPASSQFSQSLQKSYIHFRFRPACSAASDEVDDPAEIAAEASQGVTTIVLPGLA